MYQFQERELLISILKCLVEKGNSSTWKELTAVKQVLLSLIHILSGKRIKWFTDNQNVVSIVSKGSTKTVLQELAI
jgi:hypothetical protein